MTAEPQRVALHESGHAYVAWRCGRSAGPVSVQAGAKWAGMAYSGCVPVDRRAWARLDPTLPPPLWPAAVQRKCAVIALTAAAGEAAEELLWWPERARRGGGMIAQAADLAAWMPPSRAEEIRLAVGRADTGGPTDAERLAALAAAMWPEEAADVRVQWLAYIAAEARSMVAAGADRVERVAGALEKRGSLSGRAVRAILEGPP